MYKTTVTVELSKDGQVDITPISDIHKGNNNCKFHKVQRLVEFIASRKHHYWYGLGDWMDCILHSDKRASADDKAQSIFVERRIIKKMFDPIVDRCLGLADGNHEIVLAKGNVGSPMMDLCEEWGVPYLGYSGFLRLTSKERIHHRCPIIYYHHGSSAGRKTGGSINRVEELAQYWGADFYNVAHAHKLWTTSEVYVDWTGVVEKVFCMTGGFLETCTINETGYGEVAAYPPQRLGTITNRWKLLGHGKNNFSAHVTEV